MQLFRISIFLFLVCLLVHVKAAPMQKPRPRPVHNPSSNPSDVATEKPEHKLNYICYSGNRYHDGKKVDDKFASLHQAALKSASKDAMKRVEEHGGSLESAHNDLKSIHLQRMDEALTHSAKEEIVQGEMYMHGAHHQLWKQNKKDREMREKEESKDGHAMMQMADQMARLGLEDH